ncbi:uncharacterized protein ACLA_082270 [Aspergillus clavatus NRRL 1]|uniref:RED-like N-terminal domain-containing protein n=1 Tax=Aspergillus clavatus (strain ATCC 1007 / CBS 513.65 / DSM 816 / NCTC 3887 / NRRL 1 / QM 1276 / 107) TaxID=344612 RepID=A1CT99_ASPCL|nr:uncharacterized protein ACLA_082270 [Aspergillus clavatus NRRL 1]EAW06536.1 conserved hypothetical protein [Aspergillus clavatus NRRL 1]
MNNQQFRRLVLDTPVGSSRDQRTSSTGAASGTSLEQDAGLGGATPRASALGSRMRSSIPMTPRSVTHIDFSRQLAEQRREAHQPPSKRFKSSAAPKGTKLPTGYQDRAALLRQVQDEGETDIEKRIQALEEMVKLGQIDRATFEKLRVDLGVGGDLQSTHMVKGLDWELLKRVKAGEDVTKTPEKAPSPAEEAEESGTVDVDEEFDRVLEKGGQAVLPSAPQEKKEKKGTMAPPPAPVPAQTKSRDEILREWKANRAAAAAAAAASSQPAEPALGDKFKRIGDTKVEKKRFIEQDETGRRREVLLITDAEGKTKRKVRWLDKSGESVVENGLLMPDKDAKPLGMEVPAEIAAKAAVTLPKEDDDDDIFAGVGADYNPLGDDEDDDASSSDEEAAQAQAIEKAPIRKDEKPMVEPSRPRNYFSTSTTDEPEEADRRVNPLTKDPTLLAALKRAAALRQASPSAEAAAGEGEEDVDAETVQRRKKFIEEARRQEALDAMDMDYGFGGSRIEDEEDDEDVIFEDEKSKKRKRGPKKKKGDKNSATDVLRVLEGRKKD